MKHCVICFDDVYEKTSFIDYFQKEDSICGKCAAHFVVCHHKLKVSGVTLDACYVYNDFLESLFFQLKEGRDVALKAVFLRHMKKRIEKQYKDYTLVYMPSSKQKNQERGFFALALLYEEINLPKVELFEKTRDVKQSKQSLSKRKLISNSIRLLQGVEIVQSKLLLVDDVCTSGSTLKSALSLLKSHPYQVVALVIGVHPHFIETME